MMQILLARSPSAQVDVVCTEMKGNRSSNKPVQTTHNFPALLPLPCHHLGDSVSDRDARLLNLLLRQARRETDLQCRLWGEDFILGP